MEKYKEGGWSKIPVHMSCSLLNIIGGVSSAVIVRGRVATINFMAAYNAETSVLKRNKVPLYTEQSSVLKYLVAHISSLVACVIYFK